MTSAIRHYATGLSRNTFLLAFASLSADISSEMLYPILPVFLTQTLKASGTIVGLVDGVAQAAQNIVQGFSGALSDKLQKRKPVALAGYLMAAAAKPLMGLSSSWQGVFGARFLDRLGAGTRSAPRDALIASSVDEKDRGRAFGLEGVGFTKSAKVVDYTYDALNRLIQASTTPDISSGAPNAGRNTFETWSYDSLGNILTDTINNGSSVATSTYQYQGNIGSNYADPDAATTIGTTTLSYDNDGNLTAGLLGFKGAWDWRNRLTTATSSSETDIYNYDENNKRVRVATPSVTYHYPNDLYEANSGSASVTKHVFLNGNDVAEIVGNTGASTINYNFVDHLGSINVTGDQNNRVQEITDYSPYGKPNNHDQINAYSSLRKYIGQDYDRLCHN